jgi:hypothetical protein
MVPPRCKDGPTLDASRGLRRFDFRTEAPIDHFSSTLDREPAPWAGCEPDDVKRFGRPGVVRLTVAAHPERPATGRMAADLGAPSATAHSISARELTVLFL